MVREISVDLLRQQGGGDLIVNFDSLRRSTMSIIEGVADRRTT